MPSDTRRSDSAASAWSDSEGAEGDSELSIAPAEFTVRRRNGVCAEPMVKGYFKEPFWNKQDLWSEQLLKWLSANPVFKHNSQEEVGKMVRAMSTHLALKDEVICIQGEKQDCLIIVLEGTVNCFGDRARKKMVMTKSSGSIIDETAVLWATPRQYSIVAADEQVVVAKLYREYYTNLSIRFKYYQRGAHQEMLQKTKLLELLDEEQIAKLTDVLKFKYYKEGEDIIQKGQEGTEMFFVDQGVAKAWGGTTGKDAWEKRYVRGGLFGELALLNNQARAANVTAVTKVLSLSLSRHQFDRILGPMRGLLDDQYLKDPRKLISDFFANGDSRGPLGNLKRKNLSPNAKHGVSEWLSVFRPCSRDAISKMLNGNGVGKGLNVKGKSAKQGCLSGFVPFVQVSDNKHKPMVEQSPHHAMIKVFYKSKASRDEALAKLELVAESMQQKGVVDIEKDDQYKPHAFGVHLPEYIIREAYIMKPDLSPVFGWETGRRSEPYSMDANLHGTRGENGKSPEIVLFQWDDMDVMNPRGLLVAYAEEYVKPVVSDFDTFTVASKGVKYEEMPNEYANLMLWGLGHTESVFKTPDHQAWTSRWIEIKRQEAEKGRHVTLPRYGFGDATTVDLIAGVCEATKACGAVRHGPECFNFDFPQELDDEFLVVWSNHPKDKSWGSEVPWSYFSEEKLRPFLMDRAKEGFCFPINPVWAVRDKGWYDVLDIMRRSEDGKNNCSSWYPPGLKILERVEEMHKKFPACFIQVATEDKKESKRNPDPAPQEKRNSKSGTPNRTTTPKKAAWWMPTCLKTEDTSQPRPLSTE
jgi:cAMP-dependent protein kinase regulator